MRGNYKSPSELLLALRETGKSYWDLVGKPLTPNTGYNLNNPHAAEESEYNKWYNGSKLSDEDSEKLQLLLEEYDKDIKSNSNSLPSYKGGKDKFTTFVERMGPKVYRQLHKQGIYNPYIYDNMMRLLAWESNYGTSPLAISNHNYGGVKSSNTEYAKYKDDDAFADYYVSLIRRKYPQAVKAKDTKSYAKELKKVGYYEDSLQNYSQKLSSMSSVSRAAKLHMHTNPKQYEVEVLLDDLKKQSVQQPVSTRVEPPINKEPINKEPFVNTPIPTKAPLITRPEYLESNSLIKKSFELNMNNMLLGKDFLFKLPGFKKGKDSKKPLSDEQYIKIMEDVADANYERWGYPNQDAALLYALNANDYDYRGYYNKYPPNSANSLTHWSDEFKTAYHPSFSDESKYSGHKSKYNPDGIVGGHWYNEMFVPSFDQLRKLNKLPGFTGGKDSGIKEYASNEDMHINPDGSITTRSGNTGSVILPDVNVYAQKDYNSAFDYSGANEVMGTIADFTPVVGDVKQGLEAANDLRKGKYKEAAIGAGLLLLPNVLEKPLKYAGKAFKNLFKDTKPMFNKTAMAIKNYRYPLGRPRVPNDYLTIKPQVRTRVGDVEIGAPNMAYRQGNDLGRTYQKYKDVDASVAQHQIEYNIEQLLSSRNGRPYISREEALDKAIANGTFDPVIGIEVDGHSAAYQDTPMYSDGFLWYGTPKIDETLPQGSLQSGLLVTPRNDAFIIGSNKATPYRGTGSGISRSKSGITTVTDNGGRLIPADADNLGLELNNISAYNWEPGYGYRRVFTEEAPTIKWRDAVKPPKITSENAANITPKQWTAAQDAAIAKGDMAEARRLRDLHFKTKAPNTKITDSVWHGSRAKNFNTFDLKYFGRTDGGVDGYGHYFGTKRHATGYKNPREFYLNMENPYTGNHAQFFNREEYFKDNELYERIPRKADAIRYKNGMEQYKQEFLNKDGVIDTDPLWGDLGTVYLVPRSNQIKLANAVTYDDKGVRIPLGKRDNFKLNDIRYGILPFGVGLTGYGLLNKQKTSRGSARKGNTKK